MKSIPEKIVKDILKTLEDQGVIVRFLREEMEADLVQIVAKHMLPGRHQKAIIIDEHVDAPIVHWALCKDLKDTEATLALLRQAKNHDLTYSERCMLVSTLRDLSQEELIEQIDSWDTLVDNIKLLIKDFEFFRKEK
jgi:hypothetical protein